MNEKLIEWCVQGNYFKKVFIILNLKKNLTRVDF